MTTSLYMGLLSPRMCAGVPRTQPLWTYRFPFSWGHFLPIKLRRIIASLLPFIHLTSFCVMKIDDRQFACGHFNVKFMLATRPKTLLNLITKKLLLNSTSNRCAVWIPNVGFLPKPTTKKEILPFFNTRAEKIFTTTADCFQLLRRTAEATV